MKPRSQRLTNGQGGYTLVELIIAMAIGVFVISALTSVMLTSVRASNTALGRIQASSEIRNFELRANDDFASSSSPPSAGCTNPASPCQTPIVLNGFQVSNALPPVASSTSITYQWDGSAFLDRVSGAGTNHSATDVTGFNWYVDTTTNTVVVQLTVTVLSYSETQTFRFYPRVA